MAGMLPRQTVHRRACHGNPMQRYYLYVPGSARDGAPLMVAVRGTTRGTRQVVDRFAALSEASGAVLVAPCFPREPYRDYRRLGRCGHGPRADSALHAILEEMAWMLGTDTSTVHMFGFAGGAQFVHRYVMAYPRRVARAVAAAAGWYTIPDARARYPYGIRPSPELPGVRFDPEAFLQVPVTTIVGDRDVLTSGLCSAPRVTRQQGANRVERARHWVGSMRAAARACRIAPRVTLQLIPGVDHSFTSLVESGGLGERVFSALFGSGARLTPRSA
jgi:dienelactone hydrolase